MALKWGYRRAFLRCALIFAVGVVLQLVVGDLDNSFLRYPWGLILAVNYLYLIVLANLYAQKWQWVRRLSDHYASASALASMVVMCGFSCSAVCGIFPDQGLNLCPLHWQAYS